MVIVDGNIRFGRGKKWSTQDCEIRVEGRQLTIFYTPRSTRSFFNVSECSGRVIATGNISETGTTSCLLQFASEGTYNLNLVDGEDLLEQKITLS